MIVGHPSIKRRRTNEETINKMKKVKEELESKQKGDIVENRISEAIIMESDGQLTVYKPNSDIDGIDLIVKKRGEYNAVYIQVKSRFSLHGKSIFIQDIQRKSFTPHKAFYLIFAYFDLIRQELSDYLWLIPSLKFKKLARPINPKGYQPRLRFQSPIGPLKENKYTKFLINKTDLAATLSRLMRKLK